MKLFGYVRALREDWNGSVIVMSRPRQPYTTPVYVLTPAEVETLEALRNGTARVLVTAKSD